MIIIISAFIKQNEGYFNTDTLPMYMTRNSNVQMKLFSENQEPGCVFEHSYLQSPHNLHFLTFILTIK